MNEVKVNLIEYKLLVEQVIFEQLMVVLELVFVVKVVMVFVMAIVEELVTLI